MGEELEGGEREPGVTRPPLATYYFFLAVFFFELPFFFAFFFAAIIVSFKVNLGMLIVRDASPHSLARFFERCILLHFHRSPEKISEKPCTVRQFYATAQKKCNTHVKYF